MKLVFHRLTGFFPFFLLLLALYVYMGLRLREPASVELLAETQSFKSTLGHLKATISSSRLFSRAAAARPGSSGPFPK